MIGDSYERKGSPIVTSGVLSRTSISDQNDAKAALGINSGMWLPWTIVRLVLYESA